MDSIRQEKPSRFDVVIYERYSDDMMYCAFCTDPKTGESLRRIATRNCARCGKAGCAHHPLTGENCAVRLPRRL